MKAPIFSFLVSLTLLAASSSAFSRDTGSVPLTQKDSDALVKIFKRAGLGQSPSIVSGRYFTQVKGIHCILQVQAPGAVFTPACILQDTFDRKLRVNPADVRALTSILARAGYRPVNNGRELTLEVANAFCQSDRDNVHGTQLHSCSIIAL